MERKRNEWMRRLFAKEIREGLVFIAVVSLMAIISSLGCASN